MRIVFLSTLISILTICVQASSLSSEVSGPRYLKSAHGTYLRSNENEYTVDMGPDKEKCTQWFLVENHGTVLIKPFCSDSYRSEYLARTSNKEIAVYRGISRGWTPFKNNDGTWSFQCEQGEWLSSDKNGTVKYDKDWTTRFLLESWTVHNQDVSKEASGLHTLESIFGTSISAHANPRVVGTESTKQCEQWFIEDNFGQVMLRLYCQPNEDRYLACHRDDSVAIGETFESPLWTPVKNEDGTWSFQCLTGSWLVSDENGYIYTVRNGEDPRTNFRLDAPADEVPVDPSKTGEDPRVNVRLDAPTYEAPVGQSTKGEIASTNFTLGTRTDEVPVGPSLEAILLIVLICLQLICGTIFVIVKLCGRNQKRTTNDNTTPSLSYRPVKEDAIECADGSIVKLQAPPEYTSSLLREVMP